MTTEEQNMTKEELEEATAEGQPEPASTTAEGSEVKCGYVVAIKHDGQIDFKVFGNSQGLIELLGLHEYAKAQITKVKDSTQKTGDALVIEAASQLAQLINSIGQAITAPQPDNKLIAPASNLTIAKK
jgi:hypothetical protein